METKDWKDFIEDPAGGFLRLAKPKVKGILGLVFSRAFVILTVVALELLFLLGSVIWFRFNIPYYDVIMAVFTLLVILYLFNCSMDSSAKLTWIIVIALAPVAGALFLVFTKTDIGHRKIRDRIALLIEESREELRQSPRVLRELEDHRGGVEDLWRYINRSGTFPVFDNTEVTYFPLGEYKFEAMLEELRKAEDYIFLEYFIIEEGEMWGKILSILAEKAEQGVDIRVMYDGMCELSKVPFGYAEKLSELGIKAKDFSPIRPFISTHYNYRDHRKILVIDGKVAFNGGVNLADEYINKKEVFGHWKDTAVMMKGDAAKSFALMFLQMWHINEKDPEYKLFLEPLPGGEKTEAQRKEEFALSKSPGYVMPFADCPLDEDKVGETVYIDILYRATEYVHIMTPYLILDGELETALKYAAERGVDVRIILPGVPDKKMPYALAKSHYRSLVNSGVKIFEYTPGFVHAKVFVSDDRKAVVGTINLDYRSLYHHFECGTFLYDVPCIREIEADYLLTEAECRAVTPETIRNESIYYKAVGGLMKLVAPLL